MNDNFYENMKDNIKNIYDSDEMDECIKINGEMDSSEAMEAIRDAVVEERYINNIPVLENGDIDINKLLSMSSDYVENIFIADLERTESIAKDSLDEQNNQKVHEALLGLAAEHWNINSDASNFDESKANIDSYIYAIKEAFNDAVDTDIERQLSEELENLKYSAQAETIYMNEDAFEKLNKEEEQKRLEEEVNERQRIIEEKNERDAERALERSNKFHENLNKLEDNIKEGVRDLILGKPDNKIKEDSGMELE